jgi:serine/threonine-protein kinase
MALEPAKLSDFKLAGALGSGATARVYEAVHSASGRAVAIKIMEQASSSREMRERFAREALLLSGVTSRHVSKILGFGFEKGQPFLVLERLHGETLDAKLRRDGPVPPPLAVRWMEQLIIGVRDCHSANVIHRDIKPSNIFLHREGAQETVKLIDFGVARLREIAGHTGGLTSTNHLIGSMGYMAPEQFESAKTVGFPADLYAVGVVVFRTLTGRLPFVSRSLETVIKMKSEQSAPTVSSMGTLRNQLLDGFVQKALMREVEPRFQSAREMLEQWWRVVASLDEAGVSDITQGMVRANDSRAGAPPQPSHPPPPLTVPFAASPLAAGPNATVPFPQRISALHANTTKPMPQAPAPPAVASASPAPSAVTPQGPRTESVTLPQAQVAHPAEQADQEDLTIRRPPRGPVPLPSGTAAPPPSRATTTPFAAAETNHRGDELTDPGFVTSPNTVLSPAVGSDDETFPTFDALSDEQLENDLFDVPTKNNPDLRKLVERELELQRRRKEGG